MKPGAVTTGTGKPRRLSMHFEPNTIEHLGAKLYPTLPPVIGELVSNAWDADSPSVEIIIPDGPIDASSVVTIRDYGCGMTRDQLQDEYLKIGRNRREGASDKSESGNRRVMGRKGLGKLSAFGIANVLEVRSVRAGTGTCIRLNYDRMHTWHGGDYEPEEIEERSGATSDPAGTEIQIKELRRTKPIDVSHIKEDIARRFSVIGMGFSVSVNNFELMPADRRKDCDVSWDVTDTPGKAVVDATHGWHVAGWVGLTPSSSQANRGVDIVVRGKAAEMNSMFGLPTTHAQWARAYIVGTVDAEFLDAGTADEISTGRGVDSVGERRRYSASDLGAGADAMGLPGVAFSEKGEETKEPNRRSRLQDLARRPHPTRATSRQPSRLRSR